MSSLREMLDHDKEVVLTFFEMQPEVYEILDTMIMTSRALLWQAIDNLPEETNIRLTMTAMLWQTMCDYVEQSLLLIIKTQLDAGYAVLRMASELARDIARIDENDHNFAMWNDKAKNHNTDDYKSVFKFNKEDPTERFVYTLYNTTSIMGVHGHTTRAAHMRKLGPVSVKDKEYMAYNVTHREVLDALVVWLFAFFPINIMAAKPFINIYSGLEENPFDFFINLEEKFRPAFYSIKNNVKKNFPKSQ
jgi:hypothetical protein